MKKGFLNAKPKAKAPAQTAAAPSSGSAGAPPSSLAQAGVPAQATAPTMQRSLSTASDSKPGEDEERALAEQASRLSLAAAGMTNSCLPPELVWEMALQHLESRDLLNLAMCSHATYELLSPQLRAHTYRLAKGAPRPTPAAARLIKRFAHDSRKQAAFADTDSFRKKVAKSLASAVNVRRIAYAGNTPCVDMFGTLIQASRDCLKAVQIATREPEVEFHENTDLPNFFKYASKEQEETLESFNFFSRMERGFYMSESPPTFPLPKPCVLGLQALKNLRTLRLGNFNQKGQWGLPVNATELLRGANWKHLEVLELSHFHATSPSVVANFFKRHSKLHTVILLDGVPDVTMNISLELLEDTALPNIRHFAAGKANLFSFLAIPRPTLKSIGGVQLDLLNKVQAYGTFDYDLDAVDSEAWSDEPDGQRFLDCLGRQRTIEELDVFSMNMMVVTDLYIMSLVAPQLKRFRLHKNCAPNGVFEDWLGAFRQFPLLEELAWPVAVFDTRPYRSYDEREMTLPERRAVVKRVRSLAEVCTRLKSVQMFAPELDPDLNSHVVIHRQPGSRKVSKVEMTKDPGWMRACDEDVRATRPLVSVF